MLGRLLQLGVVLGFLGGCNFAAIAQGQGAVETPTTKYNALLTEFAKAQQEYAKQIRAAASVAEQGKIFREQDPQPVFAGKFLELAKKHPNDPVAYASLTWIVETSQFGPAAEKMYSQAIALLVAQHAQHKDSEKLFDRMVVSPFAASGAFLQAAFEKHPSPAVRGRAGFHWALHLKNYCDTVQQLRTRPEMAKNVELFVGPELFQQLQNTDTTKLMGQVEDLLVRVQKDHGFIVYKKTVLARAAEAELFELRSLAVGKVAPDIEGEDTDGKKLRLSDYRGKVVVIVFWGTWCGHCMAMLPQERALVKRLEGQPFAILGVNSDEDRAKLKPVLEKERITWRSFFDGGNSDGPIATKWNVQGWPAVYVLDAKGVIRFKHVRDEMLDRAVDVLMSEMKGR